MSHLREELIVVVLKDPYFSLQLPDVVGGGICRRKEGKEERLAFQRPPTENRPAQPLKQKDHIELKRFLCTLRDPDTRSPNDGDEICVLNLKKTFLPPKNRGV